MTAMHSRRYTQRFNTDCHWNIKVGQVVFSDTVPALGASGFDFFQKTYQGIMKSCKNSKRAFSFESRNLTEIEQRFSEFLGKLPSKPLETILLASHM
jgi:hypothetical protein